MHRQPVYKCKIIILIYSFKFAFKISLCKYPFLGILIFSYYTRVAETQARAEEHKEDFKAEEDWQVEPRCHIGMV